MISLTAARDVWAERCRRHPPAPVMTITDDGLVVGATVLAPMHRDPCGMSGLAIDGADDRILALLSAAHAKAVGPRVLDGIRRASKYWRQGKTYLASIELALSGLPPLGDPEGASFRLFLADKLLADGLSPHELVEACGLDPAALNAIKGGYSPDERRVPAGNPDGGQWTSDGGETAPTAPGIEPTDYKPVSKGTAPRCEDRHTGGRRADLGRQSAEAADRAAPRRFPPSLRRRSGHRVARMQGTNPPRLRCAPSGRHLRFPKGPDNTGSLFRLRQCQQLRGRRLHGRCWIFPVADAACITR